jgi:ribosomal protein S18 acetylase RimI-like enzyme
VSLRPARASDLPALLALEAEFPGDRLSRRSFRHLLDRGNADVWVYQERGVLLGDAVVLYRQGSRSARLYSLVVVRSARGRGIGQSLLAHAERRAAAAGCAAMQLEVRNDNAGALGLYAATGYTVVVQTDGYYEDGAAAIRLRKQLTCRAPSPAVRDGASRLKRGAERRRAPVDPQPIAE